MVIFKCQIFCLNFLNEMNLNFFTKYSLSLSLPASVHL